LHFDYNITTGAEFLKDIGFGEIVVTNLSANLAGSPVV